MINYSSYVLFAPKHENGAVKAVKKGRRIANPYKKGAVTPHTTIPF